MEEGYVLPFRVASHSKNARRAARVVPSLAQLPLWTVRASRYPVKIESSELCRPPVRGERNATPHPCTENRRTIGFTNDASGSKGTRWAVGGAVTASGVGGYLVLTV